MDSHFGTIHLVTLSLMRPYAHLVKSLVLSKYDGVFQGLKSLLDVGDGKGIMAEALSGAFPHLRCTVLDLPPVVANLNSTKNVDFVGGKMFESIPSADAVLLKVY